MTPAITQHLKVLYHVTDWWIGKSILDKEDVQTHGQKGNNRSEVFGTCVNPLVKSIKTPGALDGPQQELAHLGVLLTQSKDGGKYFECKTEKRKMLLEYDLTNG